MRKKLDPVVAIACSDIHLSVKPPLARSKEPSWFEAMKRTFDEIKELANEHEAIVVCAGDIFDKWNSCAELINFAIETLPNMFAIPGNHDLPMHSHILIEKSAYWTLVKSGRIKHLTPKGFTAWTGSKKIYLTGHPFGQLPVVKKPLSKKVLHIGLIHQYLWVPGAGFPGAAETDLLKKHQKTLKQFNVAVVGDNHMGFIRKFNNGTRVVNCGAVFRRKSNEADYEPKVGLIHASGKVLPHKLDTSQDVLTRTKKADEREDNNEEIQAFVQQLAGLESCSLNFRETMKEVMKKRKISPNIQALVMEAMNVT